MVVVQFPRHARASAASTGYKSGRNSDRGTPEIRSTARTRRGGTSSHCETACSVIPRGTAKPASPPTALIARRSASCLSVMATNESIAFFQNQALLHCPAKARLYTLAMSLGNRIQAARKRLEMSQKELGNEFGISPAAVSSWERDLTMPEFDHLCRLPGILKVPADWLLTGGVNALPDAEFINAWNRLSEPQRRHAIRYLEMLASEPPEAGKPRQRAS